MDDSLLELIILAGILITYALLCKLWIYYDWPKFVANIFFVITIASQTLVITAFATRRAYKHAASVLNMAESHRAGTARARDNLLVFNSLEKFLFSDFLPFCKEPTINIKSSDSSNNRNDNRNNGGDYKSTEQIHFIPFFIMTPSTIAKGFK